MDMEHNEEARALKTCEELAVEVAALNKKLTLTQSVCERRKLMDAKEISDAKDKLKAVEGELDATKAKLINTKARLQDYERKYEGMMKQCDELKSASVSSVCVPALPPPRSCAVGGNLVLQWPFPLFLSNHAFASSRLGPTVLSTRYCAPCLDSGPAVPWRGLCVC